MSAINLSSPSSLTDSPWNRSWPANELETVSACPVCGSTERTVLFDGLKDNVFFVALGKWILHSCTQCNSAYLDPRPSRASIGKAYGSYYTHAVGTGRENDKKLAFFKRLRRMMSNGYLNHRFGTNRFPASGLGQWVAKLLPSQREILDTEFRYLPKPTQGQRLLDIGCGNGFFLASAKEAGWQVSGVEPDPVAAAVARDRGVHVMVGTVDLLADESNCFDVITLSHVIEHVHEPQKLLESVHRLLKPGGVIYVETPNIESHGAALFKKEWRGLESPRHLVLFNLVSLSELLFTTGFEAVRVVRRTGVQHGMYLSSVRMVAGYSPYSSEPAKLSWLTRAKLSFLPVKTARLEFITVTARKMHS